MIRAIIKNKFILYLLSRVSPRLSFLYYISRYNSNLDGIDALNYYFKKINIAKVEKIDSNEPLYVNNIESKYEGSISRYSNPSDSLVSVIITSYNDVELIRSSVMSIIGQSYKNIEIIVIDDNSSDGTFDVLLDLNNNYENIKLIRMGENNGTYVAKNIGLINSIGDYITFQDSDDWSHPNRISEHIMEHNLAESKGRSSVSISSLVRIKGDGSLVDRSDYLIDRMSHISMMFNRSVIETNGYFKTSRVGNDSEFLERIRINTDINYLRIKKVLMFCSSHPGSLTTANDTKINSEIRVSSQKEWKRWHSKLINSSSLGYVGFEERDYDWKIVK